MNGYDVDGISVWSVVVAERPLAREHFFRFLWCTLPTGFILCVNAWQAFFSFFQGAPRGLDECLPVEEGKGVRMRMVTAVFTISMTLHEDSKT